MADKFHINEMGNPGKCSAQKGGCPFGEESDHYDSADSARSGFEKAKTEQLFAPLNARTSGKLSAKRSVSELNKLAKTSTDPEILMEAVETGSIRTLGNLSTNPEVPKEILEKAFDRPSDRATKIKLQAHPNFPIGSLDEDGLVQLHRKNAQVFGHMMASDDVTDEQAAIVMRQFAYDGSTRIIANPNNKVTTESLIKFAEMDSSNLGVAVRKNPRYPIKDRLPHLSQDQTEVVAHHTTNSETLRDIYNSQKMFAEGSKLADRMVANQNTPSDVLDKLGDSEVAKKDLAQNYLYYHANATPELRAKMKALNPGLTD